MSRPTSRLFVGFMLLAVALAGTQLVLFRDVLPGPDSIAYFEVADQIQRIGYARALSLHWSPLYPLYLLAVRTITALPLSRELAVTTAADAASLVVLCAIVGAAFASLGRLCFPDRDDLSRSWLVCACGLSLFLSFGVLRVGLRLPDAIVTCFAVLAVWAWSRAMAGSLDLRWSALAGLFSGFAFLARANLLHWSVVVGAAACLFAPGAPRARRAIAYGVFVLGLLASVGPQVYVFSSARGQFTFGESGKLVFAETYGATWPNGHSAWPVRASGGDVRVFTDARDLNFPGFYDPGREYNDAVVPFRLTRALLTVARSVRATLLGYWSPSFALLWPLMWALWPVLMFGITVSPSRLGSESGDRAALRRRLTWFLIASGSAGVAMHLVSFSLGYYLPPYLIPLLMGLYLGMLSREADAASARVPRQRAVWIMAAGLSIATVLTTAGSLRRSDELGRASAITNAKDLAAALDRFPSGEGRRRIAVVGPWMGLYAIRLSNSQVIADIPDPAVIRDPARGRRAEDALRERGAVALLVPRSEMPPDGALKWTAVSSDWALAAIGGGLASAGGQR